MKNDAARLLLVSIFCAGYSFVYGGEFYIDQQSVKFNGYSCGAVFRPGQVINMRYIARNYSFSGASNNYQYIVFRISNTATRKSFVLLQLAREYLVKDANDITYSMTFQLPNQVGTYTVDYYRAPLFSPFAYGVLGPDNNVELAKRDVEQVEIFTRGKESSTLCAISAHSGLQDNDRGPAIYLQVNKKIPTAVNMNDTAKEMEFSWYLDNVKKTTSHEYRYRLYPDEEWSAWQTDKYVKYYLINKGMHEFEVECRYNSGEQQMISPVAQFSFTLEKHFLGRPEEIFEYKEGDEVIYFDKGEIRRTTKKPKEIVGRIYDNSTALLIGVDSYDDPLFGVLPFVQRDINAVANVFTRLGFTIKNPGAKEKEDIMREIRSKLISMGANDRLVIYISSHGFLDPINSRPLIAAKDCKKTAGEKAVSVDEIKSLIQGKNMKGKHVLLILDCCSSGVGIMDKAAGLTAVRTLATQRGSHILTAGMSDQNARMYEDLKMSVFTHFLVTGLSSKAADYTKDGIITLSELLIYVQYNVATYTGSAQVPMSGRIEGYGEIIFQ